MNQTVRVGMAAIIMKDGKVLMHKRKGDHSPGVWSFPGGHLEINESFEECIRREIKEETDLDVGKVTGPIKVTNEFYEESGKSYVTLFMVAEYIGGEAKIMEPEKCEAWKWHDEKDFPKEIMLPIKNLIESGYDLFRRMK
ncbi:MAG: NUDIX domain-containing protein [Nanoarchaeota archaeon]